MLNYFSSDVTLSYHKEDLKINLVQLYFMKQFMKDVMKTQEKDNKISISDLISGIKMYLRNTTTKSKCNKKLHGVKDMPKKWFTSLLLS